MSPRKPGRKRPLDRDSILRAAIKHADEHGIERLNMRSLAGLLDVGVMSIYHYVANKDDLLAAMVESVASEIAIPRDGEPWRQGITEIAVSAHQTFLRHPWLTHMWWNTALGPVKLAHMESVLRVLREGGFSVALACRAYHAVTMHTLGFTLQQLDFPIAADEIGSAAGSFLGSVEDPDAIPYFVEHVQHHIDHPEPDDDFTFMLDMILDGFERLLERE